jgi:hypothetical protein
VIAEGDGHDLTKCSTVKGLGETGRRDRDTKLPPGDKRPRLMQSRPAARSALDNRGSTPDLPLTTRNGSLYSRSFASRACNRGRSQSIATSSTDMSLNPTTSIPSRSAARCNRATTSAYGLPNSTYSIAGDVDGLRHTEGEIVTGKKMAAPLSEIKGCVTMRRLAARWIVSRVNTSRSCSIRPGPVRSWSSSNKHSADRKSPRVEQRVVPVAKHQNRGEVAACRVLVLQRERTRGR